MVILVARLYRIVPLCRGVPRYVEDGRGARERPAAIGIGTPAVLRAAIDKYLADVVAVLRANEGKTALTLAAPAA